MGELAEGFGGLDKPIAVSNICQLLDRLVRANGLDMVTLPGKNWQPPYVKFDTTMGELAVELYWQHAPNTCRNFAELSRRGYYNGTKFHRIISDFMIQGGDPTATGRGGASIYGETFNDEIHPGLKHTGAGVLSMANSGPNTNGSQFFITLAPTQWLDGKHAIFGRICQGMSVVKRMGQVETDSSNDRPVDDVKILRAEVVNQQDELLR